MPIEVVDETNGPGRPAGGDTQHVIDRMLGEIWQALGYPAGRVPVLDEVLQEIRNLRDAEPAQHVRHADITPLMPDDEPEGSFALSSVSYPDGMIFTGYSVDDVLKLRAAALAERTA